MEIPEIRIQKVQSHTETELVENLHDIGMYKRPDVHPYKDAKISIAMMETKQIWPAQRYILASGVEKMQQLERELKTHGYDLLGLDGYLSVKVEGYDEWIDILPPIVELSQENERQVSLLNDGMHRVYLARLQNRPVKVAYVMGIPEEYPYYAYPLPRGWDDVEIIDELKEGYVKKFHRIKDHHTLYRDFNSGGFRNVGGPRKQT